MKDEPWLIELLNLMRKRPAMYISHTNTEHLNTFIAGCCHTRMKLGLGCWHETEENILEGFTYWLAVKANSTLSVGWSGLISHCFDKSETNIDTFYERFDEYMVEREYTGIESLKERYEALFNHMP